MAVCTLAEAIIGWREEAPQLKRIETNRDRRSTPSRGPSWAFLLLSLTVSGCGSSSSEIGRQPRVLRFTASAFLRRHDPKTRSKPPEQEERFESRADFQLDLYNPLPRPLVGCYLSLTYPKKEVTFELGTVPPETIVSPRKSVRLYRSSEDPGLLGVPTQELELEGAGGLQGVEVAGPPYSVEFGYKDQGKAKLFTWTEVFQAKSKSWNQALLQAFREAERDRREARKRSLDPEESRGADSVP